MIKTILLGLLGFESIQLQGQLNGELTCYMLFAGSSGVYLEKYDIDIKAGISESLFSACVSTSDLNTWSTTSCIFALGKRLLKENIFM